MVFALGFVIFWILWMIPGDFLSRLEQPIWGGSGLTREQLADIREVLGLDLPWHEQYFNWLRRALQGDLGVDLEGRRPVMFLVRQRLFNTILLNAISFAVTAAISLALGVWLSSKSGSRADLALTFVALFLYSLPPFAVLLGL